MKLLLVEDNESILMGVSYLLKEEGYTYAIAKSCQKAWEKYSQEAFDLVLLDINLPDGDGYEL